MILVALALVAFGAAACAVSASALPHALPQSCNLEASPATDAAITKLADAYVSDYDMGALRPAPAVITHLEGMTERTCSYGNGFSLTLARPATMRNYDKLLSQFSYEYPEILKGIGTYAFAIDVTNTETTFTDGRNKLEKSATYDIAFLILASGTASKAVHSPVLIEIDQDKGTLAGEKLFAKDLVALLK
jgi:hypothetical protein